jgi:hypothetical protein
MGMKSILENPAYAPQPMQRSVGHMVLNIDAILVANLAFARMCYQHDLLIYFAGLVLTKGT